MTKLDLQHLEELYKNATQGEWTLKDCGTKDCWCNCITSPESKAKSGVCPSGALFKEDASFIVALHNAFPSILKTLKSYEEAIEQVREMDFTPVCVHKPSLEWECCYLNFRSQRDSILKSLDEQTRSL